MLGSSQADPHFNQSPKVRWQLHRDCHPALTHLYMDTVCPNFSDVGACYKPSNRHRHNHNQPAG
jgi:hypothetical protein